ncbi:VWA domain-containing protein [Nocardia sp. CNY236]|uniref:vWA domain-containing protein n=1 Tax=Nocardia sp. CNY236 TaxID=1169152 RepID=UPI00040AE6DB|nr:VWA domain-containing protein [Nocardia sp. CNY236]
MVAAPIPADGGLSGAHGIAGHLVGFVEALRARGIAVGSSETVDAGRVVTVLDLMDREVLREGLACALLRRTTHRATFDGLFDLWFPAAMGERTAAQDDVAIPRTPSGEVDIRALRSMLAELLAQESAAPRLEVLAGELVDQMGRYQSARGPSFSAYQAMKEVQPHTLLAQILDALARRPDASEFDLEIARRAARQRIAGFRETVEAETKRRVAERIGRDRVASYGVPRQAEDVDFLRASEAELAELRRSTQRLARILAARLALRRRHARRGAVDLRRTLRKSMSTGGVPIDLANRKPRPGRPELVLLCDVSGSVAGFSNFTLLLVSALREQFSRVRIFAFVDQVDEVTSLFDPNTPVEQSMTRIFTEANVVGMGGHSDYGRALAGFADAYSEVVTSRSSLLILGDARTNYRDPELATLRSLVEVAKHAHWLNPEPREQWGSGDSAAEKYREVIEMHECRSAAQLTAVVSRLLPV